MITLIVRYKNPYGKGTNEKGIHIDNEDRLSAVIKDQKSSARDSGIKIVKLFLEDDKGNKIRDIK